VLNTVVLYLCWKIIFMKKILKNNYFYDI
jgi:hypothetical protein